jgi:hypothetical protein
MEEERPGHVAQRFMHFQINRDIDPDPEAWTEEGEEGRTERDKYLRLFRYRCIYLATKHIRNAVAEKIEIVAWRNKIRSFIEANAFLDPGGLFALCVTKVLTSIDDRLVATALGHTGADLEVYVKKAKPVHFLNVDDLKVKLEGREALASLSGDTAAPMLLPVDETQPCAPGS